MKLDLDDELTQWLVYIYGKDKEMIEMVKNKNKMIKEVDEQVQYLQGEEAEIRIKELHDKWEFDRYCDIRDAQRKGMKLGKKEGEREGKRNGIRIIAKKMLALGYNKKQIIEITNISEKDLDKIIA